MAGTSRIGRRTVLRPSAVAGLAGMAGVTAATPGRPPGPKDDEVLAGVSGSPRAVTEADLRGDARAVHENETLGYAVVRFPTEAPDRASENFISAITEPTLQVSPSKRRTTKKSAASVTRRSSQGGHSQRRDAIRRVTSRRHSSALAAPPTSSDAGATTASTPSEPS